MKLPRHENVDNLQGFNNLDNPRRNFTVDTNMFQQIVSAE